MVKTGFTEASRHHLDALSQGVLRVERRLPRGISTVDSIATRSMPLSCILETAASDCRRPSGFSYVPSLASQVGSALSGPVFAPPKTVVAGRRKILYMLAKQSPSIRAPCSSRSIPSQRYSISILKCNS